MPHATLVTPNAEEAAWMCGFDVVDHASALDAARCLAQLGPKAILIKGGHIRGEEAVDLLHVGGEGHELSAPRIETAHTHGTGCTYSAAIATQLAHGRPLAEAVEVAKAYVTEAIRAGLPLGSGSGPTDHFFYLRDASLRDGGAATWLARLGFARDADVAGDGGAEARR